MLLFCVGAGKGEILSPVVSNAEPTFRPYLQYLCAHESARYLRSTGRTPDSAAMLRFLAPVMPVSEMMMNIHQKMDKKESTLTDEG